MNTVSETFMRTALERVRILPVVVIDDIDAAVPLAHALVAGGLDVIEVTLRSGAAISAIKRIATHVPEATVAAGTVTSVSQISECLIAGADFLVTPGTTPSLLDELDNSGAPFLPGACTASEIMTLLERQIPFAKLFPAEAVGGIDALSAFAGPFPEFRFCPTGGINARTARDYLALPNVICVGGTWLTPRSAIAARKWNTIERLAREATLLGPLVLDNPADVQI